MFEKVRQGYFPYELPAGVVADPVDAATCFEHRTALFSQVFPAWTRLPRFETPPAHQRKVARLNRIYQRLHAEYFLFYAGNTVVGWSLGRMENPITFRMINSGLLEPYRRHGVYTAFTRRLLSYLKALGYERVSSHHHVNNRAVLAAKLKIGFVVAGSSLGEDTGAVVSLLYYLHEDRYRAYEDILGLETDTTWQPL